MTARILIIEDEPAHRQPIEDGLRHDGYDVLVAVDGEQGLQRAAHELPDVIVLDVLLPDISGLEVARQLRRSLATRHIPIIVVTADGATTTAEGLDAGGTVFLAKPFKYEALLANIRVQIQSRPPFLVPPNEVMLTLHVQNDARPTATVSGAGNVVVAGSAPVSLNAASFGPEGSSVLRDRDGWRRRAKKTGFEIYRELFQPRILDKARYFMKPDEDHHVRIRLQTDRSQLATPFEMMFDDAFDGNGEFLVLRHPLSRYLTGVTAGRQPISRKFFNDLVESGEHLRILLIASNTRPDIPAADAEIEMLAATLPQVFRGRRLIVDEPTVLTTSQATLARVEDALTDCKAHIVHYAGHGIYRPESPEQSGLLFWTRENRSGDPGPLSAAALASLMRLSQTRLFYLGCCHGTSVGSAAALATDDFIGIADALVQVGVPSVLGLRAPVADMSARLLAGEFYKGLALHGEPDRALLDARRRLSQDRDDNAWLSPLLIFQGT